MNDKICCHSLLRVEPTFLVKRLKEMYEKQDLLKRQAADTYCVPSMQFVGNVRRLFCSFGKVINNYYTAHLILRWCTSSLRLK